MRAPGVLKTMSNGSLSFLDRYKSWTPYFLSLLRAVSGLLFMQHGLQKVFGLLGKVTLRTAAATTASTTTAIAERDDGGR